jgi:cobalt/nickel transport system permease protein
MAWLALVALSVVAGLGPWRLSRASFVAAPFLLAALPLVFTRPEDPLGSIILGPLTLTVSGEGLRWFTTIAFKSWVSVQAALLLTFTTPFHELIDGLRLLRLPTVMVVVISFMYRYLAVLADEATRMLRARAARSADRTGRGGGRLGWRARVVGGMIGALFLRSYERSERVYAAMLARGFEGQFRHLAARRLSGAALIGFGVLMAGLAAFVVVADRWLPHA